MIDGKDYLVRNKLIHDYLTNLLNIFKEDDGSMYDTPTKCEYKISLKHK